MTLTTKHTQYKVYDIGTHFKIKLNFASYKNHRSNLIDFDSLSSRINRMALKGNLAYWDIDLFEIGIGDIIITHFEIAIERFHTLQNYCPLNS